MPCCVLLLLVSPTVTVTGTLTSHTTLTAGDELEAELTEAEAMVNEVMGQLGVARPPSDDPAPRSSIRPRSASRPRGPLDEEDDGLTSFEEQPR